VLIIAVALIGVALLLLYLRGLRIYTFDVNTYHYDVGVQFRHEAFKTRIVRGKNQNILEDQVTTPENPFPIDSLPVFFENQHRFILPENMSAVIPAVSKVGRVEYFSMVTENAEGDGYVIRAGKTETEIDSGFLFDGKSTYVFLEPADIVWGDGKDEQVHIEAMSFMVVIYNVRIEIYPRDEEEGMLIDTGMARVMAHMNGYSVDLSKDILYWQGQEMLLFSNPAVLNPLGKGDVLKAEDVQDVQVVE
jgi:hypothetical protein